MGALLTTHTRGVYMLTILFTTNYKCQTNINVEFHIQVACMPSYLGILEMIS